MLQVISFQLRFFGVPMDGVDLKEFLKESHSLFRYEGCSDAHPTAYKCS